MRTAKQKTGTVATFILTLFALAGSALAADLPAALVDPYLRVQTALAADKIDGLKADAGQIVRAAGSLGAQAKPIADAGRQRVDNRVRRWRPQCVSMGDQGRHVLELLVVIGQRPYGELLEVGGVLTDHHAVDFVEAGLLEGHLPRKIGSALLQLRDGHGVVGLVAVAALGARPVRLGDLPLDGDDVGGVLLGIIPAGERQHVGHVLLIAILLRLELVLGQTRLEFGTIELNGLVPEGDDAQRQIIFDPLPRVDGIEPSGDPLLDPRASVYLASGHRRRAATV